MGRGGWNIKYVKSCVVTMHTSERLCMMWALPTAQPHLCPLNTDVTATLDFLKRLDLTSRAVCMLFPRLGTLFHLIFLAKFYCLLILQTNVMTASQILNIITSAPAQRKYIRNI